MAGKELKAEKNHSKQNSHLSETDFQARQLKKKNNKKI